MKNKDICTVFGILGLILVPVFSTAYAQGVPPSVLLQSSSINSGGTNSTSSGFSLISSIGEIAGFLRSSSFQLITGFLPLTQGGNTIPSGLFSGVTPQIASDGSYTIPIDASSTGSMQFSAFYPITPSGNTASMTTDKDFTFSDAGLGGSVLILAGTQITADTSTWSGNFLTPQSSGVSVAAPSGSITTKVIRTGLTNIDFSLNQPVRFTFIGAAGQNAASIDKNGVLTGITGTCNGIDFNTVNAQLGAGQACKINNNVDLLVWTRSLSDKITFIPAGVSGGGDFSAAPSFTTAYGEHEYPLIIGNVTYPKLGHYNEKTETARLETQTQIPIKLLVFEDGGTQNVLHVALYMNLHGPSNEAHKSDTWLVYEKNRPLEINDPNGFIADTFTNISTKGNKFEIVFNIAFAKPMGKSNLVIIAWDYERNGLTTSVIDAFEVTESKAKTIQVGEKMFEKPQPKIETAPEPITPAQPTLQEARPEVLIVDIKKWAGYAPESISDSELLKDIGVKGEHIPSWFMKSTGAWTATEKVSPQEFVTALKYLHEKGIVK